MSQYRIPILVKLSRLEVTPTVQNVMKSKNKKVLSVIMAPSNTANEVTPPP